VSDGIHLCIVAGHVVIVAMLHICGCDAECTGNHWSQHCSTRTW